MIRQKKSSRKSGGRNPEVTRNRILEAATRAFAQNGFEGTSLGEILIKAKVSKRMVYHYYGNKEGLYRAVHIHQWQVLFEWFAQELIPGLGAGKTPPDLRELLLKSVAIFHDFSATHQKFIRLMMWDGLEGGRVSQSIWKDIRGPLYFRMEELVKGAQNSGLIAQTLEANHLVVSFLGAISFYFGYAPSLSDIYGKDPLSETALEERKQQTLELFRQLLQKN
jgi:TetR/AcrR family transcriptional regulator